jgi:hypothetical protein
MKENCLSPEVRYVDWADRRQGRRRLHSQLSQLCFVGNRTISPRLRHARLRHARLNHVLQAEGGDL